MFEIQTAFGHWYQQNSERGCTLDISPSLFNHPQDARPISTVSESGAVEKIQFGQSEAARNSDSL